MGSVEVYDYKRRQWVPYIPDYEKYYQHFKDMRDGYVQPDHLGRYVVGSGAKYRKMKEMEESAKQRPALKLVTPVAQAVEIAKSEVKRDEEERKKEPRVGRKKPAPGNGKRKRRLPHVTGKRTRYEGESQLY